MVIPESINDKPPSIRDVITKINNSVLGSLYFDSSFLVSYQILSARKPPDITTIYDSDIFNYTIESKSDIYNNVRAEYSPYADSSSGENAFQIYSFQSSFVDNMVGISKTLAVRLYLYSLQDATVIAQRMLLIRSLASSIIKINANTYFSTYSLNDFVQIEFDRLYKRFSNRDRKKICKINSISKNVYGTSVELSDVGNLFNRVMSITENSASIFTSALDSEKIKNGFIVDNSNGLPDSVTEKWAYSNIIG
jgi:hypothetical protein